jgi:hypothetical protein
MASRPLAVVPTLPPLYARAKNLIAQNDRPVRKLAKKVFKVLGDRLAPEDGPIVRKWCELEILRAAMFAETSLRGVLLPNGEPSSRVFAYTKLAAAQLQLEKELGMTPASRMSITATSRHAPVDIATAFARANRAEAEDAVEVMSDDLKREP